MKILALEFSSVQRSVAVVSGDAGDRPVVLSSAASAGGQAIGALGLVETALRAAQVGREQIECVAVGLGPGSYTGIRIAIALAQGWQLGRPVKLLGLSSADVLVAGACAAGLRGRVHVVIDAQRDEVYLATYNLATDTCGNPGWQAVGAMRIVPAGEATALAAAGETMIGPEVNRWCPQGRVLFPEARELGLLAAGRDDFVPGERLEPIYLRAASFVKAPPPRPVV